MYLSTNSKDEFEQPTADGKMSTYTCTMYMYIWCIYDYQTVYIFALLNLTRIHSKKMVHINMYTKKMYE